MSTPSSLVDFTLSVPLMLIKGMWGGPLQILLPFPLYLHHLTWCVLLGPVSHLICSILHGGLYRIITCFCQGWVIHKLVVHETIRLTCHLSLQHIEMVWVLILGARSHLSVTIQTPTHRYRPSDACQLKRSQSSSKEYLVLHRLPT